MITAAENRPWPSYVPLADSRRARLSIPSVIRPAKIATVDAAQATRIGAIAPAERRAVQAAIAAVLG